MSKEKVSANSITFKKYHIFSSNFMKKAALIQIIDVPLHGLQARSRNRIANILNDRVMEIDKERMDLIKKFGEKDEKDEIKLDPVTKNYIIKDQDAFQKEFTAMMDESTVFDILPSNKADWQQIKQIVLDCKIDFDINGTTVYDEICTEIEKI